VALLLVSLVRLGLTHEFVSFDLVRITTGLLILVHISCDYVPLRNTRGCLSIRTLKHVSIQVPESVGFLPLWQNPDLKVGQRVIRILAG
jgi:hypothetical protein